MGVLCHLSREGRTAKPQTLREYGKLREQIIMRSWTYLSDDDFVDKVTRKGHIFYGALLNGHDLQELQFEKLCWRLQSIIGQDFDECTVGALDMARNFTKLGLTPWVVYHTFSNKLNPVYLESYRLLWKVDIDLNLTYKECLQSIKALRRLSGGLSDPHAYNPTRMWQGANSGPLIFNKLSPKISLKAIQ